MQTMGLVSWNFAAAAVGADGDVKVFSLRFYQIFVYVSVAKLYAIRVWPKLLYTIIPSKEQSTVENKKTI